MARYVLRIVDGSAPGNEFDLAGTLDIGRDPHLGLPLVHDPVVSHRHARATAHAHGVVIEDVGSRNGTFVNGVRIAEPTLVKPGELITVGDTTLEIRELPTPEYVLALVEGRGAGRHITLARQLEIGRDPTADVPLVEDHLVSRLHVSLTPLPDGVAVDDLGSRNGTFVNGQRIDQPTLVRPGDRILVGETTFEVHEPPPPSYVLEVVGGRGAGRQIPLTEPLQIGRDPTAGLALVDDLVVSRAHARLTPLPDGISVEDLGSRNGTFVNSVAIQGPTRLDLGDRLVVGGTVLELRRGEAPVGGMTIVRPSPAGPDGARAAPPEVEGEADEELVGGAPALPVWTFVLTSIALFMAVLDNLVVLFALPSISRDLDASVQQLEWTVNAFTLTFAVFLLTGATLGDRFGRKRVFSIGVTIFTLASLLCALAPNIEILLIGRAIQGFGGAIITPLSLTILSSAFPKEKRGLALGAWSGIAGLGAAIGPVVGGALVSGLSWHWIFWLNVPIGAVVVPLCLLKLRESFGPVTRLDIPGVALASLGFFGIIFGVIRGSELGWTEPQVVIAIVAGLLLVCGFVLWELRAPAPMLPMRFFRSRAFAAANGSSLCMYFGLFGSIFLISQFLQGGLGYSAVEAGVRTLPWTGMPIFIAPVAGILAERIGGRPLMALGMALQAGGFVWLALIFDPDMDYIELVPPMVIIGVGMSLFFAPVAVVVLGTVRLEDEGQASGANNAIRELGGVLGVAVLATIFAHYGSLTSPQEITDGLIPAVWVGAVVLALGAAIALLIPSMRPRDEALTMSTSIPAVGGFTPGVTLVRPALRPAEASTGGRAPPGRVVAKPD